MKDYIEEMMKTAGVEPNITYFETVNPWAEISSGKLVTKERVFTAAKQLQIIKLIGTKGNICITLRIYNNNWCITTCKGIGERADFTQALAQLTTELMKTGELDKEKVKEILEC